MLYALLPFTVLITLFYSLLIWAAVILTEDYIVTSYLSLESQAFQEKYAQSGRAAVMPNAIYLKGYWSTDANLPVAVRHLPIGHHEIEKDDIHVLVSAVAGEAALLVLVMDESSLSQTGRLSGSGLRATVCGGRVDPDTGGDSRHRDCSDNRPAAQSIGRRGGSIPPRAALFQRG